MKLRLFTITLAFAVAACEGERGETAEPPLDASAPAVETDATRGAIEGREFNAIEIEALRPAFEKETVIKLNAIVRRSLETANEYTAAIRGIRAAIAAAARDGASEDQIAAADAAFNKLDNWHERALAAQRDMDAAVAELAASGEDYSEEILAGMVQYVNDVERLLREEKATLRKNL